MLHSPRLAFLKVPFFAGNEKVGNAVQVSRMRALEGEDMAGCS